MDNARDMSFAAFSRLVVTLKADVEEQRLAGLALLRRLRVDLADLYAMGPLLPRDPGPDNSHFDAVSEEWWITTGVGLAKRLSSHMYWTVLLPLTCLTVGDAGTELLAAPRLGCVARALIRADINGVVGNAGLAAEVGDREDERMGRVLELAGADCRRARQLAEPQRGSVNELRSDANVRLGEHELCAHPGRRAGPVHIVVAEVWIDRVTGSAREMRRAAVDDVIDE
jgi:hypothetical protein